MTPYLPSTTWPVPGGPTSLAVIAGAPGSFWETVQPALTVPSSAALPTSPAKGARPQRPWKADVILQTAREGPPRRCWRARRAVPPARPSRDTVGEIPASPPPSPSPPSRLLATPACAPLPAPSSPSLPFPLTRRTPSLSPLPTSCSPPPAPPFHRLGLCHGLLVSPAALVVGRGCGGDSCCCGDCRLGGVWPAGRVALPPPLPPRRPLVVALPWRQSHLGRRRRCAAPRLCLVQ